jgi:hypothetical protein
MPKVRRSTDAGEVSKKSKPQMRFDGGRWSVLVDADEVRKSEERRKVIAALKEAGDELGPKAIADRTDMKAVNVRSVRQNDGKRRYQPTVLQGIFPIRLWLRWLTSPLSPAFQPSEP